MELIIRQDMTPVGAASCDKCCCKESLKFDPVSMIDHLDHPPINDRQIIADISIILPAHAKPFLPVRHKSVSLHQIHGFTDCTFSIDAQPFAPTLRHKRSATRKGRPPTITEFLQQRLLWSFSIKSPTADMVSHRR